MRFELRRYVGLLLSVSFLAGQFPQPLVGSPPRMLERTAPPQVANTADEIRLIPRGGTFRFATGNLQVVRFQDPDPSLPRAIQPPPPSADQPPPTIQPPQDPTGADEGAGRRAADEPSFGGIDVNVRPEVPPSPVASGGETGGGAVASGASDLGQLLSQSVNTESVDVQRRSPVALDPNIRGYRQGQIYTQAEGAYFLAVRQDLDTMISKIDPTMIDNVVVLSGPYGVQYGPGFSFIDIDLADTPRYECGPEHHARILSNIRTNGGQLYSRTTAYGGDRDWGYRLSYGDKKGSDYLSGNDLQIPSSYDSNDVWAEFGYSINPDQRVELRYLRDEQIDTEYPGQFFNIDDLMTDSFNMRVLDEGPQGPWTRFVIDTWYNRTRYNGDNLAKRRPDFPEVDRTEFAVDSFLQDPVPGDDFFPPPMFCATRIDAETDGDMLTTGGRAMMTFGEVDDVHMNLGGDFRYIEQNINERIFVSTLPAVYPILTRLPRSRAVDPGLFAEYGTPLSDFWTVKVGGRVDFYNTDADATFFSGEELKQQDTLLATNYE